MFVTSNYPPPGIVKLASPIVTRVGRWWQKVVLTTGFYRLKPAGKKCGWQKVSKNNINFIMKKTFLFLFKTNPDM